MALTPTTFVPDEDTVTALIARVPTLVGPANRNCFAGSVQAYDLGSGIPHLAAFVTASGGSPSRRLKGNAAGTTDESHPILRILIRSQGKGYPDAFQIGQALARQVFYALHLKPPTTDYCECECVNSQPSYLGRDEDGHHEWRIIIEMTVDVVSTP